MLLTSEDVCSFVIGMDRNLENTSTTVISLLHIRMAQDLAAENWFLKYYGVEMEEKVLRATNPNTFLLRTIQKTVMRLLWDCRKDMNESNYHAYYAYANKFFDEVFNALPEDLHNKKYLPIRRTYGLPAIATFMQQQLSKPGDTIPADIYAAVSKLDWTGSVEYWEKYAGEGQPIPGRNGSQLIMRALEDNLHGKEI